MVLLLDGYAGKENVSRGGKFIFAISFLNDLLLVKKPMSTFALSVSISKKQKKIKELVRTFEEINEKKMTVLKLIKLTCKQ